MSFPIIQEFEMLMQEFIKEVINIHKCKFFFFFLILCGLADREPMRAHYPGPPRVFYAGLRAGPAGQALIAIPNNNI